MSSSRRTQAREVALQALYWEASSATTSTVAVRELSQRFQLSAEVAGFASDLVGRVDSHRDELRQEIEANATNWSVERIARIDGILLDTRRQPRE